MNSLIYEVAVWGQKVVGYQALTVLPILFFTWIIIRQLLYFRLDLVGVALGLAAFPMLTPWLSSLLGFDYFTMLNYDLQARPVLKVAAVILISIFCSAFYIGSHFASALVKIGNQQKIKFTLTSTTVLFIIIFSLLFKFLEAHTILFNDYGTIKSEDQLFSSTVHQIFNIFAAVFLNYVRGDKRRRAILIMYLLIIALSFLMSRRTLTISVIIILVYSMGNTHFTIRQMLGLAIAAFLLWFVGISRTVGVFNYLSNGGIDNINTFFSLPGGASNVFVGSMGVIDLINSGDLNNLDKVPIVWWLDGRYESEIYQDYGYQYNGGMHLANTLYWNFGTVGVILGGVILGYICKRCDAYLRTISVSGGTLASMLAAGFVLTLSTTLWYSPIALIKLTVTIIILHSIIRVAFFRQYAAK
ncbi:hypothetical protein [Kordiimonas pumila]|uniref:Oligosaccharide repeat unit polymerase n=1 Tax=Kordiimonas pumila TaxID=2161677 RepID=A0ABV7D5E9_9PROT|nr:hypothetical protein [Kordiimonas pumila]